MRRKLGLFLLFSLLLPAVAAAQRQRMPQAGGWSFWGLAGLVSSADEVNDNTVGLSGGVDYYLNRSFSLGAAAGFWRADSDLSDDTRVGYFTATAGYNWEFGKLHPFVQGGAGLYRLEFPFNSETKFGAFGGGGLDYFLTRSFAVEGVLRYHLPSDVGRFDTEFFEALGGVKFYF
jgi:hypothetical protein